MDMTKSDKEVKTLSAHVGGIINNNSKITKYCKLFAFLAIFIGFMFPEWAITCLFCWVMVCVFVRDLVKHTHSGGLYPTLGMLGTFCGILIGLIDFNVNDIEASLPLLLSGLKVAFVTSIVGVAFSILRRAVVAIGGAPIEDKTELSELTKMNAHFSSFLRTAGDAFGIQIERGLTDALRHMTDRVSDEFSSSINRFTAAVNTLSIDVENMTKMSNDLNTCSANMENAANKLSELLQGLSNTIAEIGVPLAAIQQLAPALAGTADTLDKLGSVAKDVSKTNQAIITQIDTISFRYQTEVNKFFNDISKDYDKNMQKAGDVLVKIVKSLSEDMETIKDTFEDAAKTLPGMVKDLKDGLSKANTKTKRKGD